MLTLCRAITNAQHAAAPCDPPAVAAAAPAPPPLQPSQHQQCRNPRLRACGVSSDDSSVGCDGTCQSVRARCKGKTGLCSRSQPAPQESPLTLCCMHAISCSPLTPCPCRHVSSTSQQQVSQRLHPSLAAQGTSARGQHVHIAGTSSPWPASGGSSASWSKLLTACLCYEQCQHRSPRAHCALHPHR